MGAWRVTTEDGVSIYLASPDLIIIPTRPYLFYFPLIMAHLFKLNTISLHPVHLIIIKMRRSFKIPPSLAFHFSPHYLDIKGQRSPWCNLFTLPWKLCEFHSCLIWCLNTLLQTENIQKIFYKSNTRHLSVCSSAVTTCQGLGISPSV